MALAVKKKTPQQIAQETQQVMAGQQKPQPTIPSVSQEDLNALQAKGIDVFNPRVLNQISAQDTAAMNQQIQREQAVQSALQTEQNLQLQPQPAEKKTAFSAIGAASRGLQSGSLAPQLTTAGNIPSNEMLGKVNTGTAIAAGAAVAGALALPSISAGIAANTAKTASFASKLIKTAAIGGAGAIINDIFSAKDSEEILTQSMRSTTQLVNAVKVGALSPEEGMMQLQIVRDDINEAERAIQTARINPVFALTHYKVAMVRLRKAQNDLELKRRMMLNAIASGIGNSALLTDIQNA